MRTIFMLLGIAISGAAFAQGDVKAGEQLAKQGKSGVAPCSSCHGAQGEGNAAGGFPRISGMPAAYLQRQLAAYSDGSRKNEVMAPIAKQLSESERASAAAYFAGLSGGPGGTVQGSGKSAARGSTLANVGDPKLGVQGCVNCHGPGGAGEPPSYPPLAGQHASYLLAQLKAWRDGSRNTDPSGQMPAIAKRLNDADAKALSDYFAVQPWAPVSTREKPAQKAHESEFVKSGPTQTKPTQGVGTEQGGPTSGGAQGPGGGTSGTGPGGTK